MGFELDPSYKDVPQRIADFKALHPDGCLRPVDEKEPYRVECIKEQFFIVYTAAAYRGPDDKLPGIGTAWEPFPGKTPYTKDSELQNAETSAWGRAIVAALRSESKAIASAEDVRNRQADAAAPEPATAEQLAEIERLDAAIPGGELWDQVVRWTKEQKLPNPGRLTVDQAQAAIDFMTPLAETAAEGDGAEPTAAGSAPDPDAPGAYTQMQAEAEAVAAQAAGEGE